MRKKVTKTIALAAATMLCIGAVGCQKSKDNSEYATTTITQAPTTEISTEAHTTEAPTTEKVTEKTTEPTTETPTTGLTVTEAPAEIPSIQSTRDFFRDNTATFTTEDGKIIIEIAYDSSYVKFKTVNNNTLFVESFEKIEDADAPKLQAYLSILTGYSSYDDYATKLMQKYTNMNATSKSISKFDEGNFEDHKYINAEAMFQSETDIGENEFIYVELEDGLALYMDFGSVMFADFKDVVCGALEVTNVIKL